MISFLRILVLAVTATLILGLFTFANQAAAAAVNEITPNSPKIDLEDQSEAATNENDLFTSFDPLDLVHHYTSEEINSNRLMSMGKDGVEQVQSDAEVIRILEEGRLDNSSPFPTYPHYSVDEELKEYAKRKRQIIGYDDRSLGCPTGYPNCAIGYLSNGCTAFLIGPHHAITAGHCVYNCSSKTWKTGSLDLYLGRSCYTEGKKMRFVKAWAFSKEEQCGPTGQKIDYDIAWILYDSQDRSSCWAAISPGLFSPVRICGYPTDKTRDYNCLYCSWCSNPQMRHSNMSFDHTCDIWFGMSGSPMFTLYSSPTRSFETVIGVHAKYFLDNSGNLGTRITPYRFQWSLDWMCANGYCTSSISKK